jgi:macrodomain Ter protein organizer (MatP/YcbG family)
LDKNESKKAVLASPEKPLSAVVALEEDIRMNQSRMRQRIRAQVKRSFDQKRPKEDNKGINKEYFGADSYCRVTLRLPKEAVGDADGVAVVGDFNNWDKEAMPMKRHRSGDFEITIALPAGREYRFRYLIDGSRWENDWCADSYYPNSYGCDDSVLII